MTETRRLALIERASERLTRNKMRRDRLWGSGSVSNVANTMLRTLNRRIDAGNGVIGKLKVYSA